ncbi:cell division protein PerM [Kutzneria sp. CA-103260]|uniref:cell division protein PerM n=1 Tax=Kutzneria sp. CA-103260 TaxID=2802641 RepID=UPI001BADC1AD|nr:DUF6350 family protein [Kutzneria sp. CA-103260]QUQ70756.1 hypothetical protein JJ691_85390 [Kutzneria sp. CA-103260]
MPVIQSSQARPAAPERRPARSRQNHSRVRVLAYAAVAPIVGGYAAVATVLAVVIASASNIQLSVSGVLLAAVPGWLAAHHVPLGLGTHSFAVLPLLPTALLMLMVARSANRAAARLHLHEPTQARLVVLPIAAAHAIVGVTIALVLRTGPVTASPPAAFFGCGALSALAATVGVARRCCLLDAALSRVDPVVVRGLRAGVIGVAAMSAAGALVLAFGLVAHWTTATAIFEQSGSELGSEFGMLLLTIAYLPNAIVAALAFAMGPGFTMGTFSVAPLHLTIAKAPAVPLFAALPEHQSRALLGLMIVPLAVGVFLGWASRRIAPRPLGRLRAVAVAAAIVGATVFLLAALTGGRLGGGAFSPVTVPAGLVGAVALGWVLVPAALVACLAGPKPARNVRPVPVAASPKPVAEPEPEPELDASAEAESPTEPEAATEALAEEPDTDQEDVDEPEPDVDTEAAPEAESDSEPEDDLEPDTDLDAGEPDRHAVPENDSEADAAAEDDIIAELEAEADAELAAEDAAAEADGDEDHSPARPGDK